MTTRYKTDAEKTGVKRRMAALRERKKEEGFQQVVFWLLDGEAEKVKAFLEEERKKAAAKNAV